MVLWFLVNREKVSVRVLGMWSGFLRFWESVSCDIWGYRGGYVIKGFVEVLEIWVELDVFKRELVSSFWKCDEFMLLERNTNSRWMVVLGVMEWVKEVF